jgi:cobaltochelatase CobN
VILFLTNADTEILALRTIVEGLPAGFPRVRAANPTTMAGAPALDGVDAVMVRLLGGRSAWKALFDELRAACMAADVPLLAFGGEAAPDAELTALSTVPSATVAEAFEYLVQGGLDNMAELLCFVADTVLLHGFGFEPPIEVPGCGVLDHPEIDEGRPTVGIVFYRAHVLSGNTQFVTDLADALEERGVNALPVYCYSLRAGIDFGLLADCDIVITTVLAGGASDGDEWDGGALSELGVPVVQAVASTSSAATWSDSDAGLTPTDVAMAVAIPEFDGRLVTVPFSFKEIVDDGDELGAPVVAYRTVPDRVARVAGIASRLARLSRTPLGERRIAIVLSAYPTRRSRIGNAVALDTAASVIGLLHALRDVGYDVERIPADGDALMAELAAAFTYERESLTTEQLANAVGRWPGEEYATWFSALPPALQEGVIDAWGPAPGSVYVDGHDLVFPGLDLGGVLVTVQPPRGFGDNPIAIYHSPDLAPTHHYFAFYRWLDEVWGADAVVHAGKHGTLEWLPGKSVGLSAQCAPDAALGDMPLVYPFVVNDPGEGTQAKRRGHAVIIDHLLPPMTRAETYDDLARLETLLDEHAQIAALDPAKLPAIRHQVWDLLVRAELHRDLGLSERPDGDDFDDLILHVDGYLCELKDAQIRGGLHVLGRPPEGEAEIDMVLALTRLPQGPVPSLRAGLAHDAPRAVVDELEAHNRAELVKIQQAGWRYDGDNPTLAWVCRRLVPSLRRTSDEIDNLLGALAGRSVPAGPSGAPTRGMAHVLPTGRNFYSVDPKAVPSPLAYEVGTALAGALIERYQREEGRVPRTVGLVVWGTAAMRTMGDDVAQALALLGVRPTWATESGRVTGLEVIAEAELGRPRVDVTLRISGFFRDAFPHVVALLDDAFRLAGFDDDPRIFGAKPGAYGSGILPLLESRDWRTDADLAAVYEAWSGYSYGRSGMGVPAHDAMRRRFAVIDVAVKNQDNREHDIFDSDDYLQDHGGMVATIRSLTGAHPKAWFGDSADPARPRVRSLAEEAARVVRTRVVNPKWIAAMQRHGYKGAFELAATVDYLFGYDATAQAVEDWMYERVTAAYVADPGVRKFFEASNPWALRSIVERLLEADERGLWEASDQARATLRSALLEAEGWEESR